MKLMRVGPEGQERPCILDNGVALDVSDLVADYNDEFWTNGGVKWLRSTLDGLAATPHEVDLDEVRWGSPVPPPSKVVCIGHNYVAHVRESGAEIPLEPVVFMKSANTVVGPNDPILIPPGSEKTDYEVELAIVIGARCQYLADETAAVGAIAGYAISNDVSERHFQLERGGQWVKGKSFESFNPLGPYLVATDDVDVASLDLELRVNGSIRQRSNTRDMIFSVPHLVWYLSQFMVLEPGDIVNTGTPAGVALGMTPADYLKRGDVVELSIEGLGSQRQVCL